MNLKFDKYISLEMGSGDKDVSEEEEALKNDTN